MLLSHFYARTFVIGSVVLGTCAAYGQDFPIKPVRIITGAAGGNSDFLARQLAQGMSGPLGQPVVVDNRTGVLATEAVSKAPPDGYSLLVSGPTIWLLPLMQKVPWESVNNFAPVTQLTREIYLVTVHPSLPVKSVKELVALAKARPGELNYGSSGPGGTTHLTVELLKSMTNVNIVRVPYKGDAPTITATMSGEIQLVVTDVSSLMPHVKSGRLKALAVTSAQPSPLAPGLPTVAASGVPGYEWIGMTVIMAPAKTPGPIINRLNQEIIRVMRQPDVKERFLSAGVEPAGTLPDELATTIKSDTAKIAKLIKDAGIKAD